MDLVYFAWGCFRDFVSRPGGSPSKPRPRFVYPAILSLRIRRQRGGAFAERALHHDRVEPAAELEADARMRADHLEAGFGMDPDRTGIGGIADHRNHLPVAARLAFNDQPLQQQ